MKITILSLFPALIESYFTTSIAHRSVHKGLLAYQNVDIRSFALDKHQRCDDAPFGGGNGMVLKIEPLSAAIEHYKTAQSKVIYPSPSGKVFNQAKASSLAQEKELILIAGRYEGIDQRIIDTYVDEELTIGDYVMASGELSSLVIVDTVMRLIEGAITKGSLEEESFANGLLEYPQYTRPVEFKGLRVPDILLSGNHAAIKKWRSEKSIEKTLANRPEIMHNKLNFKNI